MKWLKDKLIGLVSLIVLTLTITTNSYADLIAPPKTSSSGKGLFIVILIVLAVCIFAFIILRAARKKL